MAHDSAFSRLLLFLIILTPLIQVYAQRAPKACATLSPNFNSPVAPGPKAAPKPAPAPKAAPRPAPKAAPKGGGGKGGKHFVVPIPEAAQVTEALSETLYIAPTRLRDIASPTPFAMNEGAMATKIDNGASNGFALYDSCTNQPGRPCLPSEAQWRTQQHPQAIGQYCGFKRSVDTNPTTFKTMAMPIATPTGI